MITKPHPARSEAAALVVCEKNDDWAFALRRELNDASVRVRETRSLAECWEELKAAPASVIAIEATEANVGDVYNFLSQIGVRFPAAKVAVLGVGASPDNAWLLRDAGAVEAVHVQQDLWRVTRLATRHLRLHASRDKSLKERVWERIPWDGEEDSWPVAN